MSWVDQASYFINDQNLQYTRTFLCEEEEQLGKLVDYLPKLGIRVDFI